MQVDVVATLEPAFEAELLCIGVLPGLALRLPDGLPAKLAEALQAALSAENFEARAESSLFTLALGIPHARRLLVVGLGDGGTEALRAAAGIAGNRARKAGARRVALAWPAGVFDGPGFEVAVGAFGTGNYRFDRYRLDTERKPPCEKLVIVGDEALAGHVGAALALLEAESLARDLVNEPASTMHPLALASFAASLASPTLQVSVYDEKWLLENGFGGVLAVGSGGSKPPRFVHLHYMPPTEPRRRVAVVGKGVTFDSGGLDLKTADGMLTMRCDMAGAATVLGVLKAVAALGLPVELHGVFAAAENALSPTSYKPGDVLRMRSGRSVEIANTDAEGRLLLADCLSWASGLGVDACVDVATLTGACTVALGHHYSGLFSADKELSAELVAAGEASGELLWPLPLSRRFGSELESEQADLKNVGGRWGGACSAAWFLSNFATGMRWAHIDIAGTAFLEKAQKHYVAGATGVMVRSLVRWLSVAGQAPA
jgi:leucyl aminopeptidase